MIKLILVTDWLLKYHMKVKKKVYWYHTKVKVIWYHMKVKKKVIWYHTKVKVYWYHTKVKVKVIQYHTKVKKVIWYICDIADWCLTQSNPPTGV